MGAHMEKSWFTVKKLHSNVWGIAEFGHNEKVISYLFVGKNRAILFDTGMGIGDIKKEIKKLTNLPIFVVNSHCHFDHIGSNNFFTNVSIFNSDWSKNTAKKGYSKEYLFPYVKSNLFFQPPPKEFNTNLYTIPPFVFNHFHEEGDVFNISPFYFTVIHTPGHTPDSICLFEKTNKILVTGDTLYPGPIYLQFKESNFKDYIASIKKLASIRDIKNILPGHNAFQMDTGIIDVFLKTTLKSSPKNGSININKNLSILI